MKYPVDLIGPGGRFKIAEKGPQESHYDAFLDPRKLNHLTAWQTVTCREGEGFLCRTGMRSGVPDTAGDPTLLLVIYAVPFVEGKEANEGCVKRIASDLTEYARVIAKTFSDFTGNAAAVVTDPTAEMLEELVKTTNVRLQE